MRLKVRKLRAQTFETAIIERYRRRESSVEEALIEMYLAGVSVRRVEDITEALWGTRVSPSTVSDLNKKITQRSKPGAIDRSKASTPTSIWMASCSSAAGPARSAMCRFRGDWCEQRGLSGDSWHLRGCQRGQSGLELVPQAPQERGLAGVRLIISDACLGLSESAAEFFPDAAWQRCIVHRYRNFLSHVPSTKVREIAAMLKAIHASEDIVAAREKLSEWWRSWRRCG